MNKNDTFENLVLQTVDPLSKIMFGGSWKAMQSVHGAAGMVPFGKKHDFCPGKSENSGKLIPFLLGYVLVHGDKKIPASYHTHLC
jgi:hypothetical protein